MNAVFQELNRGEGITSQLRHTDKSTKRTDKLAFKKQTTLEQLRKGVVGNSVETVRGVAPFTFKLEDDRYWIIRGKVGDELKIDSVSFRHSVIVQSCRDTTIQIKGKVNTVQLVDCVNVNIVVDSLLSTLDVSKSTHVQAQIFEVCPTILLDGVTSVVVYNSEANRQCDIVSSRVASCAICQQNGDDWEELAIPEQFVSRIDKEALKLTTEASSLFQ